MPASALGTGIRSAANYNGLMAWGIVVLVVVIAIDRGIIERIDRSVHTLARVDRARFGATGP